MYKNQLEREMSKLPKAKKEQNRRANRFVGKEHCERQNNESNSVYADSTKKYNLLFLNKDIPLTEEELKQKLCGFESSDTEVKMFGISSSAIAEVEEILLASFDVKDYDYMFLKEDEYGINESYAIGNASELSLKIVEDKIKLSEFDNLL